MNIKITQHLLVTLLCFYSIIGMAADFIVTNTGDNGGVNPAVGAGTGTLRQAIVDANATTDPDVIKFNISGTGPHVITPSTNYEHITNPLTIDGTTQLGWVANTAAFPNPFNGTIKIAINFANTATNAQVFSNFSGLTIKGICVYGATSTTSQPFFSIQNVNNVNIYGCYFGIEADGMTFSNTYCQGAITFQTSGDNINIGSDLPAERNLFAFAEVGSGTNEYCLYFFNAFSGTGFNNIKIRGNYFNMKKDGVTVTSTVADNGIGFANIYAGNVWQIGGPNTEDGNLISGGKNGIVMSNNIVTSTTSVLIQKNIVGTDYTGLVDKGNRNNGIEISSTGKVIILDNLISGNDVNGLQDFGGTGATAGDSITVLRNIVGLNITATDAIPNTGKGMYIYQCNKSIIGDGTLANKNIIASNGSDEIFLQTCSGVKINTNYFGTKIDGVTPLPSAGHGIVFYDVQNSKILNNIITANGADGISVLLSSSLDNSFLTNSIYANAGLGIDLRNDDVTFNDATDGDAGPNYFLNFPKINSALLGSLTVDYTLDVPAGDYKMEVFGNPAGTGDPTKHGEGKIYLGSFDIT
ncbi:MAG: right-handed parallel beta-helix repeat-containing protein, partial [Saprospiraceae bacterium]